MTSDEERDATSDEERDATSDEAMSDRRGVGKQWSEEEIYVYEDVERIYSYEYI